MIRLSPENFINELLNAVDTITGHFVQKGYQAIAHDFIVTGLLGAVFLLYVVYQLLQVYYENASFSDTTRHLFKVSLVFALSLNWDVFATVIYDVVTNEPMRISKILTTAYGSGTSQSSASLNDGWVKGTEMALSLLVNTPLSLKGIVLGVLAALLVMMGTVLFTIIALGYLVMAKFFVAVYLSLAPIFIMLYLFRGTQGMTQSWVQSLLNYMMVPVFVSVVMLLTMSLAVVLLDPMTAQKTGPTFPGCVMYFVTALLCAYITYLVPQKAAALTSTLSMGSLAQAGAHGKGVVDGAKSAAKGAQKAGSSVGKGVGNAVNDFKARQANHASERSARQTAEKLKRSPGYSFAKPIDSDN